MNTKQRTSIDDLDAIGNELSEEHLRLASGGGKGSVGVGAQATLPAGDATIGFTVTINF
jgi:hypothetical protein